MTKSVLYAYYIIIWIIQLPVLITTNGVLIPTSVLKIKEKYDQ